MQYEWVVIRALDKKQLPKHLQQLSGPDERANLTYELLTEC